MNTLDDSLPTTGQGTETATNAQEAGKARRLANLRPPFKKGETGNPRGINGRAKATEVVRFLEEPFDGDKTRFRRIMEAAFDRAISGDRGSDQTIRTLLEYYAGIPAKAERPVSIPEGINTTRSLLDIAVDVYRHRLVSGDMSESEFGEMVRLLLSIDQAKVALVLKLLGKNVANTSPEEIQAMIDGETPARAATASPSVVQGSADEAQPEAGTLRENEPPKAGGEP